MTTTVSPGMAIADRVLNGDSAAVGRAITFIERGSEHVAPMLQRLYPASGSARVIGVTGPPGAGKSTLISVLVTRWRAAGLRVAVLAVDPSSSLTGGALLGDRIRMSELATDSGVFIRSMATRGNLGGLARATGDAVAVLDAAGFGRVIVETVGVGQDEVDIVKLADVCVVVLVPGMGDDVQAIKAGIMEIGDVLAINKADREGVLRTEKELENLLTTGHRDDMWSPPIVKTVATADHGIDELSAAIDSYLAFLDADDAMHASRRERIAAQRILDLLRERLLRDALARLESGAFERLTSAVASRDRDPYSVVDEIVGGK